jgi:hypothetical protein
VTVPVALESSAERSLRAAPRQVVSRVAGVAAVLVGAAAFTVASHTHGLAHVARFAGAYSPARLAAGRVWTLPLSAFLLGHPKMVGPTSVMFALLFLPYALLRGIGRAGITGMAGHVVSTLVVAAVVLPAAALGSVDATRVVHAPDYGASAALAACAGGLAVVLARRHRVAGIVLPALVAGYFLFHLAAVPQTAANVADVEHLVALGTGALVEWSFFVHGSRFPRPRLPRA